MKNEEGENISKAWSKHAAETDHVNAIADVQRKAKHNPFISDEEFKEIVNSDENYRVSSKAMNASKKDKNDFTIVKDGVKKKNNKKQKGEAFYDDNELSPNAKKQILTEKVNADLYLHTQFAKITAKNIGNEFKVGANEALFNSVVPLTVEAVNKMCKVAEGEISISEAAGEAGKDIVNVAVVGGTKQILSDVVALQIKKTNNELLKNIMNSNHFTEFVNVALIVKDSAIRYVNGEIDGIQFVEEVGEKGTSMVAGLIGGKVGKEIGIYIGIGIGTVMLPGVGTAVGAATGAVVGQMIGSIITIVSCSSIIAAYQTMKHLDDYKHLEEKIKKLEKSALIEMEKQRNLFKKIVEKEYKVWDEQLYQGFDLIVRSSCEMAYDLEGVNEGLNRILSLFNSQVKYESVDDYRTRLGEPLKLKF